MSELKEVWTVDMTNSAEDEYNVVIQVVSTEEEAIRRCRILNKKYAHGVEMSPEGDVDSNISERDCDINYQYYNVGSFCVDDIFDED